MEYVLKKLYLVPKSESFMLKKAAETIPPNTSH